MRQEKIGETEDERNAVGDTVCSYYAPAERASGDEMKRHIEMASRNTVVDALMKAISGILAVLNEHRQILVLNNTLLRMLGIDDAERVLGLRPGEALNCIHAYEQPGGCGTSRFCSTCGAAIAIVTSLGNSKPAERKCVVTIQKNGEHVDLYFRVRCSPIVLGGERFLLLFLQDTTAHQRRAALERMFFHDISNLIEGLNLASCLLLRGKEGDRHELTKRIVQLSSRLTKEVAIQKTLTRESPEIYQLSFEVVSARDTVYELQEIFASHPAARARRLRLPETIPDFTLTTDFSLLLRILTNMLINAFEATREGGEVRLWLEQGDDAVTFCVWNKQVIPEEVSRRIFQRNFSTKEESGRGLGTYAMKLFGETYLRGNVDFTTSEIGGTVFRLCLPARPLQERQEECLSAES
jgi:hypothetical protein